jgi:hypothetical protein
MRRPTAQEFASQEWRLNNLYMVIDEAGRKVRFRMNDVQKRLFLALWYLNIILKSRQHGITTFFCLWFLDTCLWEPNIHAGIIAHNREDAESFFQDKIQYAYNNLPDDIRTARPAVSENARELSFSNGSVIRVGTSMRSSTNQLLHISEFGKLCAKFPERAREVITGALNTVHVSGEQMIAIESTAEGRTGAFHDMCIKALEKARRGSKLSRLDYKFHFFPWYQDKRNTLKTGIEIPQDLQVYFEDLETVHGIHLTEGQKAWYALKKETQGDDMKREHPSIPEEAFESTAASCYFSGKLDGHKTAQGHSVFIRKDRNGDYEAHKDKRGIVQVWRYPYKLVAGWDDIHWLRRYVIGSDIGEGLGGDWSIAYVYDRVLREFVAVMASNKIDSYRWGDNLYALSLWYDNALLVPERNGAGITAVQRLIELKANLYVRELDNEIGKAVGKQYGWLETTASKQLICGYLKHHLDEKRPVYDAQLLAECGSFIVDEERGKLEAEPGAHDDRVIGAALALAGDLYLAPPEKVEPEPTGWLKRLHDKQKEGSVWAK